MTKKIKLKKTEFIGDTSYFAGTIVEVHKDRARRLVKSGAAEYVATEIPVTISAKINGEQVEFATMDPPKTEKMVTKKRRRKKGE